MRILLDELLEISNENNCQCRNCRQSFLSNPFRRELEIVDNDDNRKQIGDTTKTPFRWVCSLELEFSDGIYGGTGVLISPKHILTCGHNLFANGKKVLSVKAVPGLNGNYKPFGSVNSSKTDAHEFWKNSNDSSYDIGLIKLSKSIGETSFKALNSKKLGYWGSSAHGEGTMLIPFDQSKQLNKKVNLAGYPGDKGFNQLWWDAGKIVNVAPKVAQGLIYYEADTCPAQSGSPVWFRNTQTNKWYLIAIHTGSCIVDGTKECEEVSGLRCSNSNLLKPRTSNRGVFLSSSLIKYVQSWINQM
jgi:V8-like Glu-specific endopeptidase